MVRYNHFMFCTARSYIKVGDNIVYIHANALEMMIVSKDSSDCFMHFGNIVSNWRCSITHQRIGLFNNTLNNTDLSMIHMQLWPEVTQVCRVGTESIIALLQTTTVREIQVVS